MQESKQLQIVWTICLDELSGTKTERIGTGKDWTWYELPGSKTEQIGTGTNWN